MIAVEADMLERNQSEIAALAALENARKRISGKNSGTSPYWWEDLDPAKSTLFGKGHHGTASVGLYKGQKKVDDMRAEVRKNEEKDLLTEPSRRYQQHMTKLIDDYKAGNCGEYALAVVDYIAKNGGNHNAEILELVDGNHVVAVIDRDPKSDPADPSTWGKNAYIVDAWANKVYHASQYKTELKALEKHPETKMYMSGNFDAENKGHSIFIYPLLSSNGLRQVESLDDIVKKYQQKMNILSQQILKYEKCVTNPDAQQVAKKMLMQIRKDLGQMPRLAREKCDGDVAKIKDMLNKNLQHHVEASKEFMLKGEKLDKKGEYILEQRHTTIDKNGEPQETITLDVNGKPIYFVDEKFASGTKQELAEINQTINSDVIERYNPFEFNTSKRDNIERLKMLKEQLSDVIKKYDDAVKLAVEKGISLPNDEPKEVSEAKILLAGLEKNPPSFENKDQMSKYLGNCKAVYAVVKQASEGVSERVKMHKAQEQSALAGNNDNNNNNSNINNDDNRREFSIRK